MGRPDRIITIERKTIIRDNFGSEIEAWQELATVWAERLTWKPKQKFVQGSSRYVNISTSSFRISATNIDNPDPLNPLPATSPLQPNELDRVLDDTGITWDILGIVKNSLGHITLQVGHLV